MKTKERFNPGSLLSPAELFYLCSGISLLLLFCYLRIVLDLDGISLVTSILSITADASLILLPFLWIRGKMRFIIIGIIVFLSFLMLANSLYFRNFQDLLSGSAYLTNFTDTRIVDGAFNSLRLLDFLTLLAILISIFPFFIYKPSEIAVSPVRACFRNSWIIICAISWILSLFITTRRFLNRPQKPSVKEAITMMCHIDGAWTEVYSAFNFTGYSMRCVWRIATKSRKPLSDDENLRVKNYLNSAFSETTSADSISDSPENLIIIVVESLQSNCFDISEKSRIIPCLDSLSRDSSTLFVERCRNLAGLGRSSDAQFAINTGLMPLRDEGLAMNYATGNYPSLAKAFNGETLEIIGENPICWFHSETSESFGFNKLISNLANDTIDQDSIIFTRAIRELKDIRQPFFLFVSSLSTHDPYEKSMVSHHVEDRYLSDFSDFRDKEYMRRLSFFDSCLSNFLQQLKSMSLYDKTLILIIGDHEINRNTVSSDLWNDGDVPLLILGEGNRQYRTDGVSQLDIFPTLIDLLNLQYTYDRFGVRYNGLGQSLFDLSPKSNSEEDAYQISELIIKRK